MEAHGRLLGTPRFRFGDISYEPPPTKATALLCYLAYKGDWCSRGELLYVFYADVPESAARRNLRQILTTLRRLPYSRGLTTEPSRVSWPISTDVHAFQRALVDEDVTLASELYGGALLDGITTVDAPEFQAWLAERRDELLGDWRDVLLRGAFAMEPGRASEALRALIRHDSLDEEVLRAYLQVAASAGQSTAALRAYRAFRHNLHAELGLEPAPATQLIAAHLERERALSTTPAEVPSLAIAPVEVHSERAVQRRMVLPPMSTAPGAGTAFVGRVSETAEISRLLIDGDCRLLTILASGGTGKSRLAWEAANRHGAQIADDRFFVELDALDAPEGIPTTLATALGLELTDQAEPLRPVIDAIATRRTLVIFDNFEHLLEGAAVCSELLAGCPNLKLLVTSRERLNLLEEWVLLLEGLEYPDPGCNVDEALKADAVALFVKRATQVRLDFALADEDVAAVVEICRLVEGSPLAIEIAATWVRVLPCADIAAALTRGIDLLHRSTRNVPTRHQSMRATLEHSWALLSAVEQEAFVKQAVFVGGFGPAAAAAVIGVGIEVLAALVDKSMLRVAADGRYDRHPLIFQFAKEKLAENAALRAELEERHGAFYLQLLRERYGGLLTRERRETLELFEAEHANVSAAWRWAVANARVDEIAASTWALDTVLTHRAPEGRALLAEAIASLDATQPAHQSALAHLLIQQGHFIYLLHGADAEHDASIERGLELFRRLGDHRGLMRGLIGLGVSRESKNDLLAARSIFKEGLDLARAHGTSRDISLYLGNLIGIESELSELPEFRALCEEAAEELASLGDPVSSAMVVFELGAHLLQHGYEAEGEDLVQRGLERIRQVGDRRLEPFSFLALRALERGDHAEAEALAQEGWAVVSATGVRSEEAQALIVLGQVALGLGEHDQARRRLTQAFRAAVAVGHVGLAIRALLVLAESRVELGESETAAVWLGFVRQQTFLNRRNVQAAAELLDDVRGRLSEQALASSLERGSRLTLEQVLSGLQS